MAKVSKIFTKEYRHKFKNCILQLLEMRELYRSKQEQTSVKEPSDLTTVENVSNIDIKNAWGQKDPKSLLAEKNDKICKLEAELEETKLLNKSLEQQHKKIKLNNEETRSQENYEKILKEKDLQLETKHNEIENLKRSISELEAQIQCEKSNTEVLKESYNNLQEMIKKKTVIAINRDYLLNLKDYFSNYEEVNQSQLESKENKEKLQQIASFHQSCEATIANLKSIISEMEDRSKFKNFTKEMLTTDIETELLEEIDNISAAYDKILKNNSALEKQIEEQNLKIANLTTEKNLLSNKLDVLEDNRLYLDKERNRLEDWKVSLTRETQLFSEKVTEFEGFLAEKDAKIIEYKASVNQYHTVNRQLSNEIAALSNSNKSLKKDIDSISKELVTLRAENETYRRNCEIYKKFCSIDADVLDEIESYRKALKCVLCDSNLKNCTLIKCGHTFCESCINDRLRARQRKCPTCQVDFNANDIKKIYF